MKAIKIEKRKLKFIGFVTLMIVVFLGVMYLIFRPAGATGANTPKKTGGLNTKLPSANVKGDSAKDKMSFYASAYSDSVKRMEQIRLDPNRKDSIVKPVTSVKVVAASYKPNRNYGSASGDNDALQTKIKSIQRQLNTGENSYSVPDRTIENGSNQKRVAAQPAPDPEMDAINATLDKIMAIQNPKSITAPNNAINQPGYTVNAGGEDDATYFGKRNGSDKPKNFYNDNTKAGQNTTLTAIVANEQELQNGATVKLELGSAITVNGVRIVAGTPVYGIANIEGERLRIIIPSVRYENAIIPVSLSVYDMDGLEGIYIPGSVARDVVKESADNAIQSTGIAGVGLSFKTQAAVAGISAAKSLLSKKVKQVRVTVTAGYKVLLRDNNQMGN